MLNQSSGPTQADTDRHPRCEQFTLSRRRPRLRHLDRGPPPQVVIVQSLLYTSLETSLFAAFLAMLGNSGVDRYLWNRGGSAADKKIIWISKVENLPRHREPSGDASVRLTVARMCRVAVSLDDQPYRRRGHPLLHAFQGRFMHPPHSCSNNPLGSPLPGTSLYPHPKYH